MVCQPTVSNRRKTHERILRKGSAGCCIDYHNEIIFDDRFLATVSFSCVQGSWARFLLDCFLFDACGSSVRTELPHSPGGKAEPGRGKGHDKGHVVWWMSKPMLQPALCEVEVLVSTHYPAFSSHAWTSYM